jgi:hypothetical protein
VGTRGLALDKAGHELNQLNSEVGLRALERYAASGNEPREQDAAAIRRLARRLRLATEQANEPARRIRSLAQTEPSSLDPPVWHRPAHRRRSGRHLGPPTSRRPSNDALLTAYTGVAPLEASSTGIIRHRLNRDGKRELNAIVYRTAITQSERGHDRSGGAVHLQAPQRESDLALAGVPSRRGGATDGKVAGLFT